MIEMRIRREQDAVQIIARIAARIEDRRARAAFRAAAWRAIDRIGIARAAARCGIRVEWI